ncbi:MAG: hypothetical protein Q8O39_01685 [bacterium]|nr:hypothetical protein [bacterium]
MAKIKEQIKNIVEELGLESFPLGKQEEIIMKIAEIVYDRVLLRILTKLTDQEARQLSQLIDQNRKDDVDKMLKGKFPDFEGLLKEEIMLTQKELIRGVNS